MAASVISNYNFTDFPVKNEPIYGYDSESKERRLLQSSLRQHLAETEEIPIVIGGKEYKTDNVKYQVQVRKL